MKRINEIPTLHGTKLVLRPFRSTDLPSLVQSINDSKIAERITNVPYPYCYNDGIRWLTQMSVNKGHLANGDEPKRMDWAITQVCRGEGFALDMVVGSIAFINIDGHKAQLSYWLSRDYQGVGIMTEAVKLVADWGLREAELVRISAYTYEGNRPSQRVLASAGFEHEGVHRKEWCKDGVFHDSHTYALVREN